MKFKQLLESNTYEYNIELDNEFNGKKFTCLTFSVKLEKNNHYNAENKQYGKFGFTVYKEIKAGDLNFKDYDNISLALEGFETNSYYTKLCKKVNNVVKTGKLVTLTKDDAVLYLEAIAYEGLDDNKFSMFSDSEKETAFKVDK